MHIEKLIIERTDPWKKVQKKRMKRNSLYRGLSRSCEMDLKDKHNFLRKVNLSLIYLFLHLICEMDVKQKDKICKNSNDY